MHTNIGTTTNCSPLLSLLNKELLNTVLRDGLPNKRHDKHVRRLLPTLPTSLQSTAAALAPVGPTSPYQQQGRPPPATAPRSAARSSALPPPDLVNCHRTVASMARERASQCLQCRTLYHTDDDHMVFSACRAGLGTRTRNPWALSPASSTPTRDSPAQSPVSVTRTLPSKSTWSWLEILDTSEKQPSPHILLETRSK